jgi:hypothetical protein
MLYAGHDPCTIALLIVCVLAVSTLPTLAQSARRTLIRHAEVVYGNSADNSNHPKTGVKCPHLNTCGRGQRHGVTSFFLSARPVRTHLAFCHLAPLPARARGDGSGYASSARAHQTQAAPL